MSRLALAFLTVVLLCCGGGAGDRSGPEDPCGLATSLRQDALRQLPAAPACETDADCVVILTEIECANVQLGDCGTLVNRSAQSALDWARTEREICQAVEGSELGCSVSAICAALGAPRCQQGLCERALATQ